LDAGGLAGLSDTVFFFCWFWDGCDIGTISEEFAEVVVKD
jgi:hypothetical protein